MAEEVPVGNYKFILKNLTDEEYLHVCSDYLCWERFRIYLIGKVTQVNICQKPDYIKYDPKIIRGWNDELGGNAFSLMLFEAWEDIITVEALNKSSPWLSSSISVTEVHSQSIESRLNIFYCPPPQYRFKSTPKP
jgi:hypothetical protein